MALTRAAPLPAAPARTAAPPPVQPDEQLLYARWLDRGSRAGLVALALLFGAYVSGLIPAHVPLETLPRLWHLPVGEFLVRSGLPTGWGWTALARHGDIANLLGIVLLAGSSLVALAMLLPLYARRRDRVFLAICVAQIVVLLFAASGIVSAGH